MGQVRGATIYFPNLAEPEKSAQICLLPKSVQARFCNFLSWKLYTAHWRQNSHYLTMHNNITQHTAYCTLYTAHNRTTNGTLCTVLQTTHSTLHTPVSCWICNDPIFSTICIRSQTSELKQFQKQLFFWITVMAS